MGQSTETLIERESGSVYRDTDERESGSVYRDTDREREWVSLQRH